MSELGVAFIASLRRISAERRVERAYVEAAREQVSVLLDMIAEQNKTIALQRRTIDHQRAELRALASRATGNDASPHDRKAA